jgi:hypothetical protein
MRVKPYLLILACLICASLFAQQPAQQATVAVTISLADASGAGIAHAVLRLVPSPDPAPPAMETDAAGKLALHLKPGGYALFANVFGFSSLAAHFDVRDGQEAQSFPFVLQLAPGGSPVVMPEKAEKVDLRLIADPYHAPTGMTLAQLKALPHITLTIHNSHTNADETYSGVRLSDLLIPLGAPLGKELRGIALASYVIASGSDGYEVLLALAEIDPEFHPGEVIVADTMNGKPLDAHGGPLKLVVTEDKRPARSVRNLVSIELKTLH